MFEKKYKIENFLRREGNANPFLHANETMSELKFSVIGQYISN